MDDSWMTSGWLLDDLLQVRREKRLGPQEGLALLRVLGRHHGVERHLPAGAARRVHHAYNSYFTSHYTLKVKMAALVRETKGDAKGAAGASGARGQQKGDLEANHKCANHCIEIHIKIIEQ